MADSFGMERYRATSCQCWEIFHLNLTALSLMQHMDQFFSCDLAWLRAVILCLSLIKFLREKIYQRLSDSG
jgi:hypothetical protein